MATITLPEMSVEQKSILHDDEVYEVIDGKIVERPAMGLIQLRLLPSFNNTWPPSSTRRVWVVRSSKSCFGLMTRPNTVPTWPSFPVRNGLSLVEPQRNGPWNIVPDLAVEVISEYDTAWDVLNKVRVYLDAGTRCVWLIHPNLEVIPIFDSFTADQGLDSRSRA